MDQSSLTGESFPVQKTADPISGTATDLSHLTNMVFVGSHVTSGTGKGVVVRTGASTSFGSIHAHLAETERETAFDKEIKGFTWLLIRLILLMGSTLLIVNLLKDRTLLASGLFALTAAISISPEILPMVVMLNLSRGALLMSKKNVVVKRLDAIQNFGAMDVLCSDKTGTLTLNSVVLERHCDLSGNENESVIDYAYINSTFQTGWKNSIDEAILKHKKVNVRSIKKIAEIPFDFERKIMSVVIRMDGKTLLIAKGAAEEITARCKAHPTQKTQQKTCASLSEDGFRVIAVAIKEVDEKATHFTTKDESGMMFIGYMAFLDPLKPTVKRSIHELKTAGVALKVITGDSEIVARKICGDVDLDIKTILTGPEIDKLSDEELQKRVEHVSVFARAVPLQKERIIRALQRNGHTVGYLGDGINDAPALKIADIGISVNNAVDVAKESASIILLKKNLHVLLEGVLEGRKVFGNFMKYIRTSTSYYVGFFLTSVITSLFLPFLPLLPIQVLLNNYLYDFMQASMPADTTDSEYLQTPKTWSIGRITKYVLVLGPLTSFFDLLMIGLLVMFFHALGTPEIFRTGWFLESFSIQMLAFYVLRTRKIPFLESRPSTFVACILWGLLAVPFILSFTRFGTVFGFVQMPLPYFAALVGVVGMYLVVAHLVNRWFVGRFEGEKA